MSKKPDSELLARLERENAMLREEIERLREKVEGPSVPSSAAPLASLRSAGAPKQPLREWSLDMLRVVGFPLFSQYLSALHLCRFDRILPPTRFGTLAADERKRVLAGRVPEVVLANGLSADRGSAIKRVWARSDWPLADRILAQTSGRVLFLRTAIWVFGEASGNGADWAQFAGLKLLAAQLARDLPVDVRRNPEDFAGWADRAREELEGLDDDDRARRHEAAERLAALTPIERWFGANPPLTVLPGTGEQAWKESQG